MTVSSRRWGIACAIASLLSSSSAWAAEPAQEAQPPPQEAPRIAWIKGPAKVDLGREVANLGLDGELAFARAEDARKLLQAWGNRTSGDEVGLVIPRAEGQDWMVVFTWHPVGHVKDDEKDKIDADAILKSIQEGTEEGNAYRKERGIPALHVVGWLEPPRYDERTHNLVWATRARDDEGHESTNYDVRVLGREGYLSVTLVEEPAKLALSKPSVEKILSNLSFKAGKSYAEWRPGDKVAEYGLTALVAAGAGAAAVKLGLFAALGKMLAKSAKLIALAGAALVAGAAKLWRAARGRAEPPRPPADPPA